MLPTILINGEHADQIPADNRGLHYGDGIFETILCNQSIPSFWPQHWARLQKGAQGLDLTLKTEHYYLDCIKKAATQTEWCLVKLTVFRSGITRGVRPLLDQPSFDIVYAYSTSQEALGFQQPVSLLLCEMQLPEDKALAGIKHLNRLHQVLAAAECVKAGYEDGIVLDAKQSVVETTHANILFISEGVLHTPHIKNAGISGIGVAVVTQAWCAEGGRLQTGDYSLNALKSARAVMTVNAVRGVRPVEQIATEQGFIGQWQDAAAEASTLQQLFFTELKRSWQDGFANYAPCSLYS
jgi:4-amino-4-deoxychorismate lyase